jgi:hypothetical protein
MKYMLMIYHNPDLWSALSESEMQAVWSDGANLWRELTASGEMIMGEPLAAPREARIVRVRNSVPEITDGPFAEAKEQFVGFVIVEVSGKERAIELAQRWPDARYGAVEVRLIEVGNATS